MANLSPAPKLQFFDANGNLLVGGKLYSYAAGTTTPLATFTDSTEGSTNPNPTFLDSRGEANVWLGSALYKLKLTTATDVEIWTVDNIGAGVTLNQLAAPGGAALIGNTPAGGISATTVQGALNELDTEKISFTRLDDSDGSSLVGFLQSGSGATARTVQSKLRDVVSVKDFGAVGDGVTNDTPAFTAATATNQPIYVPQSSSFYSLTSLSSAQQKLLYGPGVVKVGGAQVQISSEPYINDDTANLRVYNQDLQPSKWPSVPGSLFNGAVSISAKRTGGFGSYGLSLTEYLVSDALPSGEFDVGITSWVNAQNLGGGSVFGMWCGSNTPSSSLSQTYSSGAAIGMEINVGNRWADFGLLPDIGVTRYTVGLQLVPDVLPAPDGSTAAVYPGSFGLVTAQSVHGHKWWTGALTRTDAIMPGGIAYQINGGSTPLNASGAAIRSSAYFTRGIDFSSAIFSNQAVLLGTNQTIDWGGSSISGSATTLGISTGAGTGEGGLYGNNYAQLAIRWASSGSASRLGFFGAATVLKPTVTGSKAANAALASLVTALSDLGLVTDSTT